MYGIIKYNLPGMKEDQMQDSLWVLFISRDSPLSQREMDSLLSWLNDSVLKFAKGLMQIAVQRRQLLSPNSIINIIHVAMNHFFQLQLFPMGRIASHFYLVIIKWSGGKKSLLFLIIRYEK